jgi:hypothetical protein
VYRSKATVEAESYNNDELGIPCIQFAQFYAALENLKMKYLLLWDHEDTAALNC